MSENTKIFSSFYQVNIPAHESDCRQSEVFNSAILWEPNKGWRLIAVKCPKSHRCPLLDCRLKETLVIK